MIKELNLSFEETKGLQSEEYLESNTKYGHLMYARALIELMRTFYNRISTDSITRLLVCLNMAYISNNRSKESYPPMALKEEECQIFRAIYPESIV